MVWSAWQHVAARNGAGRGVASSAEHHDGFVYGAQDPKLGEIVYQDMTDSQKRRFGKPTKKKLANLGRQSRERIERNVPGLIQFVEAAKRAHRRGFLWGLDGRKLQSTSEKSAPNTINQAAGAVIMKRALVIANDDLQEKLPGEDWEFVLNVHDEFQVEADERIAEQVRSILEDSIRQAGEYYRLRVPLAGEAEVGKRWAETH